MRIKRFNENQQYLTDPFDPEMETSMKVNFNEFRKSMFNQVLNICKRLGLEGIDGGQQVSVYKDTHYDNNNVIRFKLVISESNDSVYLLAMLHNYNSLCNFYDNKMEDVEKELKEYFKV